MDFFSAVWLSVFQPGFSANTSRHGAVLRGRECVGCVGYDESGKDGAGEVQFEIQPSQSDHVCDNAEFGEYKNY